MLARSHVTLLLAVAASLGISLLSDRIDPYFLDVVLMIGINIILAVSLNLINGHTGQFSLGHAGFMAIGAYASAAVTMFVLPRFLPGATTGAATWISFPLALALGGLAAALAGLVVGAPSLRLKGDYLAIVTLGFGEIIRVLLQNTPRDTLGGSLGLQGIPTLTNFFWVFGFAALTIYTVTNMVNSTYGRGFIAVHDDEIAAEAMGINTTKYKMVAFLFGAFFAGIAGGLYAHLRFIISPSGFDFMRSIEIVVMVILGGMGSTVGVIVAAVILTVLPQALIFLSEQSLSLPGLGEHSLKWIASTRMILYSFLLIVLMLACPGGLAQIGRWFAYRYRSRRDS